VRFGSSLMHTHHTQPKRAEPRKRNIPKVSIRHGDAGFSALSQKESRNPVKKTVSGWNGVIEMEASRFGASASLPRGCGDSASEVARLDKQAAPGNDPTLGSSMGAVGISNLRDETVRREHCAR
jgi:hypothetical protein